MCTEDMRYLLLNGLRNLIGQSRDRALVPPVVNPPAALLRLDEAGPAQQPHMVGHGRLRQLHFRLDVARAETGLGSPDELAARPAPGFQERKDLDASRVRQRFEHVRHRLKGSRLLRFIHTSKIIELSGESVKPRKATSRDLIRAG